ncbi:hypothetical protein [Paraburkholderia sp. BCC1886]|uniref:hypothetical protein n=1 Tax=Paraburkholderia sp. BCC1886 TaxID=2562670 RepID=UPI0011831711|nr:hypothetical protein [Paraburkholderia sp. BCC1886]
MTTTSTAPITTPTLDQPVQFINGDTGATPLDAAVVHVWEDGPVDIVVTDPSQPQNFKVRRIPYVPYGSTNTPIVPGDPRYAYQIGTTTTTPDSDGSSSDGASSDGASS